jgi:hypothetical protein
MEKISVLLKRINKYPKDFEAETIIETEFKDEKINIDFIKAYQTYRKMEFNDDYRSFEKMCLGINMKEVNFDRQQEPTLNDLIVGYILFKDKFGEEIDRYVASRFIYENIFMVPPQLIEIKACIDEYLISSGRNDIISKIINYKDSDNKDFIFEQKKRLEDIEFIIEEEF